MPKARPVPCFLDCCAKYKVINGKQVWTNFRRDRFFTWDALHGEIEVFDKRGHHLGALDPLTGKLIKQAVKGRSLHG